MDNIQIEVYEKIKKEDRENHSLIIDAVYKANPAEKTMSAEVLSKLLGVKNQGGFRYLGKTSEPKLVMLFTSGEDVYWRDEMDSNLGVFLYYGDNKTPGRDLHKTNLHGNEILRYMFELACKDSIDDRKRIPPVFIFKKATGRDVKYLGLAVPGIKGKPTKDWLTAVWGQNRAGDRFQNYKAYFTVLDTSKGSARYPNDSKINLAWLNDIESGNAFDSVFAPVEWKNYIKGNKYSALLTTTEKYVKSKQEQLPEVGSDRWKLLESLQQYFYQKDKGYSFESFAADIIQYMDNNIVNVEVTRPYKDGGFDALGRFKIFSKAENVVYVDFYLQAKCYNYNNSVTVSDTSRLISRIKDRQFGIMFTTSYVANQAYQEIIEDGHPIVIINGKNIIDYIYDELEIRDVITLKTWLQKNY